MIQKDFIAPCVLAVLATLSPCNPSWAEEGAPVVDLWTKGVEISGYLFIFIVLAALVVHLTKRYQPHWGAAGPIQLVDGRNLGPGLGVRLVRVGSRAWLLGVTRERISLLAELSASELPATPSAPRHPPSSPAGTPS